MSETVLIAESGRETGSAASRRLRSLDLIPAVVYGHGMDPLSVSVKRADLRVAVSGPGGMNTVIDLTVDGAVYPSLIKDIQRHPVRRNVQHIDFIQVNLNEEVTVSVPIVLVGEADEVRANNGLVDLAMQELEVSTTPRNIPNEISIDISEMTMDSVVRVGDIPLPSGVTAVADDDAPVVTVLIMRATEEDLADEAEATEDGEAAAESEGDADGESDGDAAE